MLIFNSLDGIRSEACFAYVDYERKEELNGSLQISFTVPKAADNTAAFSVLDYETIVEDQDGHVYVVKQINSNYVQKTATAIHKFFTLSDVFFHDTIGGTFTVDALLQRLFTDTGFTPTVDAGLASRSVNIVNFGGDNILALVEEICKLLNIERRITSGNSIHFAQQIGSNSGAVFKYADNIKTLDYDVDTTDVKTVIKGFSEKIAGATTYTSPAAATFGLREAAPFEDNNVDTVEEMRAQLQQKINDEPKVSISVDVLTFDGEVGDNVLLIHEPLDLDIETRIMAKTTHRNYKVSSITIGNTRLATISDLFIEQEAQLKENEKYTRSRFEQTRERITAEVETIGQSIATLEIKAESITANVENIEKDMSSSIEQTAAAIRAEIEAAESRSQSSIEQTAAAIRAELSNEVTDITNTIDEFGGQITTNTSNIAALQVTANSLTSTITQQNTSISDLGTRVSTAESTVSQFADEIEAKVSYSDYTGNTIVSKINLSSTSATISASRINLVGAVTVLSDITGQLGTITAGTINSCNIYGANIDISQNVKIGNKLYMSESTETGIYFDRFGAEGRIYSDGNSLQISSDSMGITSWYGVQVYGGMDVWDGSLTLDGDDVVTSRTSGLSFGYNATNNRLYITINGTDVAYLVGTAL